MRDTRAGTSLQHDIISNNIVGSCNIIGNSITINKEMRAAAVAAVAGLPLSGLSAPLCQHKTRPCKWATTHAPMQSAATAHVFICY